MVPLGLLAVMLLAALVITIRMYKAECRRSTKLEASWHAAQAAYLWNPRTRVRGEPFRFCIDEGELPRKGCMWYDAVLDLDGRVFIVGLNESKANLPDSQYAWALGSSGGAAVQKSRRTHAKHTQALAIIARVLGKKQEDLTDAVELSRDDVFRVADFLAMEMDVSIRSDTGGPMTVEKLLAQVAS